MGRQSDGGRAAKRIHGSYVVTATCLIRFLPPTLALLIRTELIGTGGNGAELKAMDAFGSECLLHQWERSLLSMS